MNSKHARAEYAPNCQVDANISENDNLLSKLEETFGLHWSIADTGMYIVYR
jgi:hypothetical protein